MTRRYVGELLGPSGTANISRALRGRIYAVVIDGVLYRFDIILKLDSCIFVQMEDLCVNRRI